MNAIGVFEGLEWSVSEDRLTLLCRTREIYNPGMDLDRFEVSLKEQGIKVSVNRPVVQKALVEGAPEWVEIGAGQPPVPPAHGHLEFYVDPYHLDQASRDATDGQVDYKNLNQILNVTKGQELVRKHDPVPGKPGVDVYGEAVLPPEARTVSIPVGEGIEIREDGHLAVAAEDGALTTRRNGLAIKKTFTVVSDVSYKTGNIRFNGTIDVGANVLSGFELFAEGDIIVQGIVEAAHLEAQGNIKILGGIHGGGKGALKAGGSITARFASDATLEAGGDILIQNQCMNCHLTAQGSLRLTGSQSCLIGGEARAGESIHAFFIGNSNGTKTLAQIGLDPELPKKISNLEEEIATEKKKLADIEKILNQMQAMIANGIALSAAQEAARVKVLQEKFNLIRLIESNTQSLALFKEELTRVRQGIVECKDTIFSGATVKIASDVYYLDHDLRYTTFYYERGEIHTRSE